MHSSRKILHKVRIMTLKVLVAVNIISLLLIATAVDSIPLSAWWVWLVFLENICFLALVAYANSGLTCSDCANKKRCMERSRNYYCRDFKPRKEKKDEGNKDKKNDNELGADQRSHQTGGTVSWGQD